MTVTNAAARVARNTEIDTKASRPWSGLHHSSEKTREILSQRDHSPASFRRRLETSASESERWLRSAAQDDDLYAMEELELQLLSGESLWKLHAKGQWVLKKSTDLGNPFVMGGIAVNDIKLSFYVTGHN